MHSNKRLLPSATLLTTVAFLQVGFAQAQETPGADKPPLNLDSVVVTGSAVAGSKMKSSVSVSNLSDEQIQQANAASVSELLRSIPGVRSESSGGESNANLTVRGLPISAGGARYVQYQEDGLPILQFGDVAFATPDSFLRVDYATDYLQVIRGGSSSTLATNAPGGIINFLSKTGEEKGGAIGFTKGVNYDQNRYDFAYGGPLGGGGTRFFIGGFYRDGEGARKPGVDVEQGGQLRANLTHAFDKGYIRVSVKHLDDHAPTYLPVPVRYNAGNITTIAGIDPRTASFYSPYLLSDSTLTRDNGRVSSNINDGLTAKTDAFGVEGEYALGGGFKIQEKFRHARNRGRFIGVFPGDDVANVSTTFASGPNRGRTYVGPAFTAVIFNTSLDNFDLTANDLKLTKTFDLGASGKLDGGVGLYTSLQHLGITWNFNQYLLQATGNQAAVLTSPINGTNGFGGCCSNTQDSAYRTTAPYAVLGYELGALNVDGSVRRDRLHATGNYNQLLFSPAGSTTYTPSASRSIGYTVDHTSYSVGANYRLTSDLALFARYSDGVAFNADRITFFNAAKLVDGSSPVPSNVVKQTEAGIKWRQGYFNTFVTAFQAKTDESNFDVTTQKASANSYDAKGVELEVGYGNNGFRILGGLTYTDAKVTASNTPALVGTTPKRQAKFVYQVAPSYTYGPFAIGASVVGTTRSKDDSPAGPISVTLPAFAVVNAFASYDLLAQAQVFVGVNNLFDKLGYTESNDGRGAARAVNGRTVKAGLKYSF